MKPVVIIAIAVGVSVVAVLGVLIGIGAYQQAQLEKEQREANQAFINLMKKVAESEQEQSTTQPVKSTPSKDCSGDARCFTGKVTGIVDGDTIKVDGQSIRLALSSTPELNKPIGLAAKQYVQQICPVGSKVIVDEDDGQTKGSYGRIIAVIYCNGMNLNQAVLDKGHADINEIFCKVSEFSNEAWVKKYGCVTKEIQEEKPPISETESTQSRTPPSYATSEIIIAEAESNPAGSDDGNEWITLYNPSSSDMDISNWIVESTHGRTESFQIPSGTIIDSCGYFTIRFPSQFLDNEDESAILLDQNGAVIDQTPVFSDKTNDSLTWKNNIPSC